MLADERTSTELFRAVTTDHIPTSMAVIWKGLPNFQRVLQEQVKTFLVLFSTHNVT